MPNDWQHVTLGSLGEFRNGANFGRDQFGSGLPVINVKHLYSGRFVEIDGLEEIKITAIRNASQLAVQRGDILFARSSVKRSGAGQAAMVDTFRPSTIFSGFVIRFRLTRLDCSFPEFLNYVLRSPKYREILPRIASGTTITNLSQDLLSGLEVPLPSLGEQRAITELLGSLDDKIEQNRRTSQKLEALARAVFKAWFVDFEPVKAKAAGATSFPGMPPATFAALPTRLLDSALAPVPVGWEVKTVGDATTLSKQQIKPQDHANEPFEHFSIPAYDAGQNPVLEPGRSIKSQKFVVVPGCVLLSKLNPRIPRVWLPSFANGQRQIASTEFLVNVPKPGWTREFLYCLFQQDDFRDSLAQIASGTSNSHQRVRPDDLLARPLVVPSKSTLDAFADQVTLQMTLRESLHAESRQLAALRDYLLPRLLSGRVRMNEATIKVGEVA